MEQIDETVIPKDPVETEERFRTAETGDTFEVYLRESAGEYYFLDAVTVTSTKQSRTDEDDIVWGKTEDETSVTMVLKWNPKEPNVGIPRPYPEGPITLTVDDTSFEVASLQK